jgi:hypothetical protein
MMTTNTIRGNAISTNGQTGIVTAGLSVSGVDTDGSTGGTTDLYVDALITEFDA